MRIIRLHLLIMAALASGCAWGRAFDPSLPAGGTFDPFLLALKPAVQMSPLPAWMESPALIDPEGSCIEVGIPPLWRQSAVDRYAVTLVFDDAGDGGPILEWRSQDRSHTSTISYGLGEGDNPVGLNSRTVLLPQALTKDGGTLVILYRGKFDLLMSVAVRPCRENATAVIGARNAPSLMDEGLQVYEDREVNGIPLTPLSGDLHKGTIVEAELSAPLEPLESGIEFVVPLDGPVEGAMLKLETLGLDPEASLLVEVNKKPIGSINFPGFELNDPSIVTDWNGRLILAGWRKGSLFVPAKFLTAGDNSIVVSLKRSEMETGRKVFLRNSQIHLRFAPRPFTEPLTIDSQSPTDVEVGKEVNVQADFELPEDVVLPKVPVAP
jgi:hypothetical protein